MSKKDLPDFSVDPEKEEKAIYGIFSLFGPIGEAIIPSATSYYRSLEGGDHSIKSCVIFGLRIINEIFPFVGDRLPKIEQRNAIRNLRIPQFRRPAAITDWAEDLEGRLEDIERRLSDHPDLVYQAKIEELDRVWDQVSRYLESAVRRGENRQQIRLFQSDAKGEFKSFIKAISSAHNMSRITAILNEHFGFDEDDIEVKVLVGLFYSIVDAGGSEEYWRDFIEENRHYLRPVGESRNKVWSIAPKYKRHMGRVLIVKEGEYTAKEAKILGEVMVNKTFRDRFFPDPPTVVPVSQYRARNGEPVLVTIRKAGKNLEEVLEDEEERASVECKKALVSLARVHTTDPTELGLYEYSLLNEVVKRLVSRFKSYRAMRFLDAYEALVDKFDINANTLVHGDFYPTNVIEDGKILDFEKAALGEPTLDIASFLTAPEFEGLDKNKMLQAYIREREMREGREVVLPNLKLYEAHCTVCQVGSFFGKRVPDIEKVEYFFEEAKWKLYFLGGSELEDCFTAYVEPLIDDVRVLA